MSHNTSPAQVLLLRAELAGMRASCVCVHAGVVGKLCTHAVSFP